MEQLKAFLEKAGSDKELNKKINILCAKAAEADELIALAAEYGSTISVEEIDEYNRQQVELSEEELQGVAGGAGGSVLERTCWFTPTGREKNVPVGATDVIWLECNSTCFQWGFSCYCLRRKYGRDKDESCTDKWHVVDGGRILWPRDEVNHLKKTPPSYNT